MVQLQEMTDGLVTENEQLKVNSTSLCIPCTLSTLRSPKHELFVDFESLFSPIQPSMPLLKRRPATGGCQHIRKGS